MSFIRFELKKGFKVGEPSVSIVRQGMFYFNSSMIRQHIKDKRNVAYHYDANARKIGFEFLATPHNASFVIQRPKNAGSGFASAKSFLNYHGINFNDKQTFRVEHDVKNKLYVIDLKEPIKK